MKMSNTKLAGIEYAGLMGISRDCQEAVIRLIQCRTPITKCRILTCDNGHCLILTTGEDDLVAIKSGFSSGYGGAGPHAFSYVLSLLDALEVAIEEYEVDGAILERLDASGLTNADIEEIAKSRRVHPRRWDDYISTDHFEAERKGELWRGFKPVMPYAIVDGRISDLAKTFFENPDEKLLTGYRRLEDIVRKRTGVDEIGQKLFSQAFLVDESKLCWKDIDDGERKGRANLFVGVFMAFRNPRAHKEQTRDGNESLREFLLLEPFHLTSSALPANRV
jgi:hypothetical protein